MILSVSKCSLGIRKPLHKKSEASNFDSHFDAEWGYLFSQVRGLIKFLLFWKCFALRVPKATTYLSLDSACSIEAQMKEMSAFERWK